MRRNCLQLFKAGWGWVFPRQIPKILDDLAAGAEVEMRLDVVGGTAPVFIRVNPVEFGSVPALKRPIFLAIVSSPVLAENLRRKSSGKVDGFVVEAATAGGIGFRCSSEPVEAYVAKGGDPAMTVGRICLCNSLCASAGIGQFRQGQDEPQLITIGDDLNAVGESLLAGRESYTAADVIERLLARAYAARQGPRQGRISEPSGHVG